MIRSCGLAGLVLLGPVAAAAQTAAVPPDSAAFVERARLTASRFADPAEAMRTGFRRLGPDFPGMGQHWVHPGRIVNGRVDADSPPVLTYASRGDGSLVLLGLAWAVPLGPEDLPPRQPFRADVWHDHTGAVDEEVLLLGHGHGTDDDPWRFRLSMVHVWTGLDNPDGILAQNNWALPFWRNHLADPPGLTEAAARAVSLAHDGREFYRALLDAAVSLSDDERTRVTSALDAHAARAEALIERQRARSDVDVAEYETVWYDLWRAVRDVVSTDQWAVLSKFVGSD